MDRGNLADMRHLWKVWILLFAGSLLAVPVKKLKTDKLLEFQKEDCTLVHPWATWCTLCIQEMPALLEKAARWKGGRVVILDVSSGFQQEHFSKKWLAGLKGQLVTYMKPSEADVARYQSAIDPQWKGEMPYTVLYRRGKILERWKGSTAFDALARGAEKLCR